MRTVEWAAACSWLTGQESAVRIEETTESWTCWDAPPGAHVDPLRSLRLLDQVERIERACLD